MEKIGLLISVLLLTSCLKEELPVDFVPNSAVVVSVAEMGSDYRNQLYYNLEKQEFVGENEKSIWDFGVALQDSQVHLFANGSKLMRVANYGQLNFSDVSDTAGFNQMARVEDESKPAYLNTAFQNAQQGDLFIVDRGFGAGGELLGFFKLRLVKFSKSVVKIEVAEMDASSPIIEYDLVPVSTPHFYSFTHDQSLSVEPSSEHWDLCFTQYSTYFEEDKINYLVTGCLLNRSGTTAIAYEGEEWENITFDRLQGNILVKSRCNWLRLEAFQWNFL